MLAPRRTLSLSLLYLESKPAAAEAASRDAHIRAKQERKRFLKSKETAPTSPSDALPHRRPARRRRNPGVRPRRAPGAHRAAARGGAGRARARRHGRRVQDGALSSLPPFEKARCLRHRSLSHPPTRPSLLNQTNRTRTSSRSPSGTTRSRASASPSSGRSPSSSGSLQRRRRRAPTPTSLPPPPPPQRPRPRPRASTSSASCGTASCSRAGRAP
jgi:hypothetical protein